MLLEHFERSLGRLEGAGVVESEQEPEFSVLRFTGQQVPVLASIYDAYDLGRPTIF